MFGDIDSGVKHFDGHSAVGTALQVHHTRDRGNGAAEKLSGLRYCPAPHLYVTFQIRCFVFHSEVIVT